MEICPPEHELLEQQLEEALERLRVIHTLQNETARKMFDLENENNRLRSFILRRTHNTLYRFWMWPFWAMVIVWLVTLIFA